jgi:hypothetical protein
MSHGIPRKCPALLNHHGCAVRAVGVPGFDHMNHKIPVYLITSIGIYVTNNTLSTTLEAFSWTDQAPLAFILNCMRSFMQKSKPNLHSILKSGRACDFQRTEASFDAGKVCSISLV